MSRERLELLMEMEALARRPLAYQSLMMPVELGVGEVEKGWRRLLGEVVAGMRQRWVSESMLELAEESEGLSMSASGTAQEQ
ncbi:MAG: hypothetical protein CV088_14360 [Nitrospira sp. LK70]|nr:hypothetical protein [Nitrospira sp. LK70]